MTRTTVAANYTDMLRHVAETLKPFGFKRTGATFRRIVEGNAAIIWFQKSTSSTMEYARFTVNLAVVCGAILDEERGPVERARYVDGHLTKRLGELFPVWFDKWWGVTENSDPKAVADEVEGPLLEFGVPYLETYVRTEALVALWSSEVSGQTGRGPAAYYLKSLAEVRGSGG